VTQAENLALSRSNYLQINSVLKSLRVVSGSPAFDCWQRRTVCGRFGYNDLKEAALSGADDLWELNAVGVVLAVCGRWVVVCRGGCNPDLAAAEEFAEVG
jgi:hypothetical protein